jgi:hypothetical protein
MRSLALVVFAGSVLSCSSSSPAASGTDAGSDSVTQTVGPEGGTLNVGGATATIPKDALTTSVVITITSAPATSANVPDGYVALSSFYTCGPSGTEFAQPVTMQMPFTPDGQPATMFWTSGSDPTFKDLGGTPQGTTMVATIRHFSAGFVGRKK